MATIKFLIFFSFSTSFFFCFYMKINFEGWIDYGLLPLVMNPIGGDKLNEIILLGKFFLFLYPRCENEFSPLGRK